MNLNSNTGIGLQWLITTEQTIFFTAILAGRFHPACCDRPQHPHRRHPDRLRGAATGGLTFPLSPLSLSVMATLPRLVSAIHPGLQPPELDHLTAVGNTLFFATRGRRIGVELWKNDGISDTKVFFSLGEYGSYPRDLTAVGNVLYFHTAPDERTPYELWSTDGVATSRAADINPGSLGSNPRNLTGTGDNSANTSYFVRVAGSVFA